MFEKIVSLSYERHQNKRVKAASDFRFASGYHIAYLTVHEFSRASAIYPILFLEDQTKAGFRPVVLMGLDPGNNLFVDAKGVWNASYIPAIIRRYPFALSRSDDQDKYIICIDEDSALISESDGELLFDEKGEPTSVVENVKQYLAELKQMDFLTQEFCTFLREQNLLTPMNMRVNSSDQIKNITGCYVINEDRLNNLSDSLFLEVRGKRYLPPIYAHLISLLQIERLTQLSSRA